MEKYSIYEIYQCSDCDIPLGNDYEKAKKHVEKTKHTVTGEIFENK